MDVIFSVTGNTLIVELLGELDHHGAESAKEKIDRALDSYKTRYLIFDFTKVTFMDSSGIGMILGRYRKLGEEDGRVAITGCSQHIRSILNMAGVFSVIDYYGTREEAVGIFDGKEVS